MDRMEMVEKIREKANITIEEAKSVLEDNNWDMLDAMIALEKAGKISEGAKASTGNPEKENYEAVVPTVTGKEFHENADSDQKEGRRGGRVRNAIRSIIRVGLDNHFVVKKNEQVIIRVPVVLPVICAIASFWMTAVVLFMGLLFELKYSFEGNELGQEKINEIISKASEKETTVEQ